MLKELLILVLIHYKTKCYGSQNLVSTYLLCPDFINGSMIGQNTNVSARFVFKGDITIELINNGVVINQIGLLDVGLIYHFPFFKSISDVIHNESFDNAFIYDFKKDRFLMNDSAISISVGKIVLPASIELPLPSTLSFWVYLTTELESFQKFEIIQIEKFILRVYNLESQIFIGHEDGNLVMRSASISEFFFKWTHIVIMLDEYEQTAYIDGIKMVFYPSQISQFTEIVASETLYDEIKLFDRKIDPRDVKMEYYWVQKNTVDNNAVLFRHLDLEIPITSTDRFLFDIEHDDIRIGRCLLPIAPDYEIDYVKEYSFKLNYESQINFIFKTMMIDMPRNFSIDFSDLDPRERVIYPYNFAIGYLLERFYKTRYSISGEESDIFLLTSLKTTRFGLIKEFQIDILKTGDFKILVIDPEVCGYHELVDCSAFFDKINYFDFESVRVLKSWTFTANELYSHKFIPPSDQIFQSNYLLAYQGATINRVVSGNVDYQLNNTEIIHINSMFSIIMRLYEIPLWFGPIFSDKVFINPGVIYPVFSSNGTVIFNSTKLTIVSSFVEPNCLLTSLNNYINCSFMSSTESPLNASIKIVNVTSDLNSTYFNVLNSSEYYVDEPVTSYVENFQMIDPVEFDGSFSESIDDYLLLNMGLDGRPIAGFEFYASDIKSTSSITISIINLEQCKSLTPSDCKLFIDKHGRSSSETAVKFDSEHIDVIYDIKSGYNKHILKSPKNVNEGANIILELNDVRIAFLKNKSIYPDFKISFMNSIRIFINMIDNKDLRVAFRALVQTPKFDGFFKFYFNPTESGNYSVLARYSYGNVSKSLEYTYNIIIPIEENDITTIGSNSISNTTITENFSYGGTTTEPSSDDLFSDESLSESTTNESNSISNTSSTTSITENFSYGGTTTPSQDYLLSNIDPANITSTEQLLKLFIDLGIPNIKFHKLNARLTVLLMLHHQSDIIPCLNSCTHNGKCVVNEHSRLVCKCHEFFTGEACQTDIRPCSVYSCLNNGTCFNNMTSTPPSFYCECSRSKNNETLFTGKYCHKKINICRNRTCSLKGVCIDEKSIPKCKCFSGYYGDDCEVQTEKMRTVKIVSNIAMIVSIVIISSMIGTLAIMDLCKLIAWIKMA